MRKSLEMLYLHNSADHRWRYANPEEVFMTLLLVVSTEAFAGGEKRGPRAEEPIDASTVIRAQGGMPFVAPQRRATPPGRVTANADGYGNYRRVNDVDRQRRVEFSNLN
jgi:hypothetical protein